MGLTTNLGLHSQTTRLCEAILVKPQATRRRGSHPLRRPLPRHLGARCDREQFYTLQFATEWRFSRWALPGSLAVTRGILVSFFSSAYWYA